VTELAANQALNLRQSQELSLAYLADPRTFETVVAFAEQYVAPQQALVDQIAQHTHAASALTAAQSDYTAAEQAARFPAQEERAQVEAAHRAAGTAAMHARRALQDEKAHVMEVGDELSVAMSGFCKAQAPGQSIVLMGKQYEWEEGFVIERRRGVEVVYGTMDRHVSHKLARLRDLTPQQAKNVRIGTVDLPDWEGLLSRLGLVTRFTIQ
jgi:hypothetical protein